MHHAITIADVDRDLTTALTDIVQRARRLNGSVASVEHGAIALLARLAESGEVRGTELAHHACLDASTVSRHLRSLEAAGYVTRRPDPADARAALIGLSPAGHGLLVAAIDDRVRTFARATAAWTDDDRATLARLTRRLADDLEKS